MNKVRRHDLDWLRVLVFGLLIIYHVGMFFVNWDWHIKNNVINYDLGWPMAFINRWRLHILFVISGMGTYYAISFRSASQFAFERFKRLGLPFVFGILLIVPPQVYFERISNNELVGTYFEFLRGFLFQQWEWNHLWFLPYLLCFSLVLLPIFMYIRKNPNNAFISGIRKMLKRSWTLYLFVIPLFLAEGLLEPYFPVNHALIGDWFAVTNFLMLFLFGFILIAVKEAFWIALDKIKYFALVIGMGSFYTLMHLWNLDDTWTKHFIEAFVYVMNTWSWILAIFGFGAKYLNKKSTLLTYCNRAVYPFYLLHQTVIIIIAFYIKDLNWSFGVKSSLLIFSTFFICWIIYHYFILKISFLHPFFGLKKSN